MKIVIGIFGLCYKLYVGLIFVVTLLFFYPFIFITLQKISWRRWSFPINVVWSFTVRILCLIAVNPIGQKRFPKGPYLIVSNHTSYFDIFVMYSILPKHRFVFMGKSEILSYPLVKTFFKKLNIPVYRNNRTKAAQSFMQAKNAANNGWSIVIFPEGGIPDDDIPSMVPFKSGAFKLAQRCHLPIVPLTFLDHYHMFSDPGNWLGPAHPGLSRVCFHPIIHVEEFEHLTEEELSKKVYDVIAGPLRERGLMKKD